MELRHVDSSNYSSDDEDYLKITREDMITSHKITTSIATNDDGSISNSLTPLLVQDHETIIRRKILENFYGESSMNSLEQVPSLDEVIEVPYIKENAVPDHLVDHKTFRSTQEISVNSLQLLEPLSNKSEREFDSKQHMLHPRLDLDSQSFDAKRHTLSYIRSMSAHSLLEKEESLSMSIRLLDSTMQTLVYENYSKFIIGADAVKSIGSATLGTSSFSGSSQNSPLFSNCEKKDVTMRRKSSSNPYFYGGLERLTSGIKNIDESARKLDEELRASRMAVVEKLRVRRLLDRLKTILNIPTTLRSLINCGFYRHAASCYKDAMRILARHSGGFESLKIIETECRSIIAQMLHTIRIKLLLWSKDINSERENDDKHNLYSSSVQKKKINEKITNIDKKCNIVRKNKEINCLDVMIPKSVADIFECAGAMLMFQPYKLYKEDNLKEVVKCITESGAVFTGFTKDMIKAFTLVACHNFLVYKLEDYAKNIDEDKLDNANVLQSVSKTFQENSIPPICSSASLSSCEKKVLKFHPFLPEGILDAILEVSTLYGITFSTSMGDLNGIKEFVIVSFDSFLLYIRSMFLKKSVESSSSYSYLKDSNLLESDNKLIKTTPIDISRSLLYLLHSVRELASGLALPEVGLDSGVVSTLVHQMIIVTEEVITKSVAHKFQKLRACFLSDCISPFVKNVIDGGLSLQEGYDRLNRQLKTTKNCDKEKMTISRMIQIAEVALSDGMHLIDEAIRSTLSLIGSGYDITSTTSVPTVSSKHSFKPLDIKLVYLAIRKCARKFALWLAGSLELLAGCDNTSSGIPLEVWPLQKIGSQNSNHRRRFSYACVLCHALDNKTKNRDESDDTMVLRDLLFYMHEKASQSTLSNLAIVIMEMCRIAERSIAENINQSISVFTEDDLKATVEANGVFRINPKQAKGNIDNDGVISSRFKLAASRSLIAYASIKGADAAMEASKSILMVCNINNIGDNYSPVAPQESTCRILEHLKQISVDCASVFGGDKMAGPAPSFTEEEDDVCFSLNLTHHTTTGAMKGIHLDVARMFSTNVQVFNHTTELMETTREAVLFTVLKIVLKIFLEYSRLCTFTTSSYWQIQVDIELLRYFLPHYINNVLTGNVVSLFNEVLLSVSQRCVDKECLGVTKHLIGTMGKEITPMMIVKYFITENSKHATRFIITD